MVYVGICRPSKSHQWASPTIIVKGTKKLRFVGNYRRLNSQTVLDRYPLPNFNDCISKLANKWIFSCVNLVRAFHNIPVVQNDICKTVTISPIELFHWLRIPFGLWNASSTFIRFLDTILFDLLVFFNNADKHFNHLCILLQRLAKHGPTTNLSKCRFFTEKLDILGHQI